MPNFGSSDVQLISDVDAAFEDLGTTLFSIKKLAVEYTNNIFSDEEIKQTLNRYSEEIEQKIRKHFRPSYSILQNFENLQVDTQIDSNPLSLLKRMDKNLEQLRNDLKYYPRAFNKLVSGVDGTKLTKVQSIHVQNDWRKAASRVPDDPEGAITSARSLLESVCKQILDTYAYDYSDIVELPKLYKITTKSLDLSLDSTTDQTLKQILGGCHSVIQGLSAFRNKAGDAHGKGHSAMIPSTKHAKLAVDLAGAMSVFLIECLEEAEGSKT